MFQCPTIFGNQAEGLELRKVRSLAGVPDGCAKVAPGLVSCSEPLMIACWRGQLEVLEVYTRTNKTLIPGKALCLPQGFCVNSGKTSEEQAEEKTGVRNLTEASCNKTGRRLHDTDPQESQEGKRSKQSESLEDTNAT